MEQTAAEQPCREHCLTQVYAVRELNGELKKPRVRNSEVTSYQHRQQQQQQQQQRRQEHRHHWQHNKRNIILTPTLNVIIPPDPRREGPAASLQNFQK